MRPHPNSRFPFSPTYAHTTIPEGWTCAFAGLLRRRRPTGSPTTVLGQWDSAHGRALPWLRPQLLCRKEFDQALPVKRPVHSGPDR
jgi:hypothetical protein